MIGFVIWSLFGVFIIGLGIKDMFSKNPVGFWANTETIKVKDVKGYNRASGLWKSVQNSKGCYSLVCVVWKTEREFVMKK